MIPFNYLGPVFKRFASLIYPQEFKKDLLLLSEQIDKGGYVLDAGSGTGILSQFLFTERKDLKFILLDPARGMLRSAPGFALKTIGTAELLPFPELFFGAVMIGDAFHHFNDPMRAVGEIRRVLKPAGILIIFEIDPEKAIGRFITHAEKIFGEPANFFSPQDLLAKLAANGFECRVSQYAWRYAIMGKKDGPRI
ncbi:MAG: Methyltransferase type 11 [Deltaproteobacteria bacterium]|nr:Methyltransferase type 11 [Deltaproteobacteria bacterium]